MGSLGAQAGDILIAFTTNDAWEISRSLKTPGAWLAGFITLVIVSAAVMLLYKRVGFLDRYLERSVMVYSYLMIAAIIFIEVLRRFILSEQAAWSTTLPPVLFMIMAWFGCAFCVRRRSHLAFTELRSKLPRTGQFLCLTLDAVLWFSFCWIIVVTSARVTANSAANYQIMLGTDDVQLWWFLLTVPMAFTLLAARVIENFLEDINHYRDNKPLVRQVLIGGD